MRDSAAWERVGEAADQAVPDRGSANGTGFGSRRSGGACWNETFWPCAPQPPLSDAPPLVGYCVVPPWWSSTWPVLAAVLVGLLLVWLVLLVVLWRATPDQTRLGDALRLFPDVVRLVKRLAGDRSLPRGVRLRLLLLLGYLALPIDLVPDFIPGLGYADDAIAVVLVLRSVARSAGPQALERHWPGTPDGLAAVRRLVRT